MRRCVDPLTCRFVPYADPVACICCSLHFRHAIIDTQHEAPNPEIPEIDRDAFFPTRATLILVLGQTQTVLFDRVTDILLFC